MDKIMQTPPVWTENMTMKITTIQRVRILTTDVEPNGNYNNQDVLLESDMADFVEDFDIIEEKLCGMPKNFIQELIKKLTETVSNQQITNTRMHNKNFFD